MGEKIKRIESIKNELAKKPEGAVKNEEPNQKIDIDEIAGRLKIILEEKGAFSPEAKEERKFSEAEVKERIKGNYKMIVDLNKILATKEGWKKDREKWTQKEPQDKLSQRMIKLADSVLKQNEEAIEEKLKRIGLLK